MNIGYRSSYERLTEKIVYETYKFFIYSATHMSSKDQIALHRIRLGLKSFETLKIFLMLQIEVDIGIGGILANEIGYRKIRYQIFWEFVAKLIRHFNI